MKTLFTSEAVSKGGRSGTISNPEGLLNIELGNPMEPGMEKRGPNPELLFAAAYSACYHGALVNAAKKHNVELHDSTVRALVSLLKDETDGYHIGVALHAKLPGVSASDARNIMAVAHETCPYSKALRGDAAVTLTVD
jgi:lipoyl-dependent peroxiredoxin